MIRIMDDMPVGTVGLEAVGKVTEEDYREVLVPAVGDVLDRGDVPLRYVLGEDFESYSPGAVWAADTRSSAGRLKGWKRVAIVSDADWLEHSVKTFGRLMPGEANMSETDDIDEARDRLRGLDDDD
jgi:SpoIIAA-like